MECRRCGWNDRTDPRPDKQFVIPGVCNECQQDFTGIRMGVEDEPEYWTPAQRLARKLPRKPYARTVI